MTRKRWSVAQAKSRFSAVLADARGGPQVIENRGREIAVVLDIDTYQRLTRSAGLPSWEDRWRRFLEVSAAVREAEGDELAIPPRSSRATPWSDEDDG